jgi:hypothetical protein
MLDFLFGSRLGQLGIAAAGFAALVACWQIDRALVRSEGKQTGRLEERIKTKEKADANVNRAKAARDLSAGADTSRLLADPFIRE